MRDIRLLTLYKQHYLDYYEQSLDSQITCLGYYDGLDLKKVDDREFSHILLKNSLVSITELWYSTGKKVEQIQGGYSNQNIGLFRCMNNDEYQEKYTKKYWEMEQNLPFFSVAFLKLNECDKYMEISSKIEHLENFNSNDNEICIALTYCTFDNSDLVILLKGNSITKINGSLNEIDRMEEVLYLHSILGIEEKYLSYCVKIGKIADVWKDTICFVDEPVKRIELHLATCWNSQLLPGIKSTLMDWKENWHIKGYENIAYSYVAGHSNINIIITNTNIRSLLALLLPEGFSTHQNQAYRNGVYNIETSIFIQQDLLDKIDCIPFPVGNRNPKDQHRWCRSLIDNYCKYCNDELKKVDEGLYSYYQAMIQTLNALDQYEGFTMSRDIFDMIQPSFYMFDGKIKSALNNKDNYECMEQLKDMMCQYLECVNSVVYHTIHTEQVYLMIPGYSGTSFSIPIKLNLFYLWYIYKVIDLLNDCGKLHSCIIVPVMESRPNTRIIGEDFESEEKLIHIRLSQRSLFHPGALMIILAHEMAHYTGKGIRLRTLRMECIIKTMSYCIAEAILPESDLWIPLQVRSSEYFENIKKLIKHKLELQIVCYFKEKKGTLTIDEYYSKDIWRYLIQWSSDILSEEGKDAVVYNVIEAITDIIPDDMQHDKENFIQNMRFIHELQQYLHHNRRILIHTGDIQQIFKELIEIYQEVFADMAAIVILDCSQTDFHNAFFVSEGSNDYNNIKETQQQIREIVANNVIFHKNQSNIQYMEANVSVSTTMQYKPFQETSLKDNLQNYSWLYIHLEDYASQCYDKITDYLTKEHSDLAAEVKCFYNLFLDQESDYNEIYACISKCIAEYKNLIKRYIEK